MKPLSKEAAAKYLAASGVVPPVKTLVLMIGRVFF